MAGTEATVNIRLNKIKEGFSVRLFQQIKTGLFCLAFVGYAGQASARYIQPDPTGLDGGSNMYAYADGNPLSKVDPTGEIAFVPIVVGIGAGLAFDYMVSKWKAEHCKCKDASTPAGPFGNAAAGAANGTFGPYATKPRTGISGGGAAGSSTSAYSQAVTEAYQSGAISVGTRGTLRGAGRIISSGAPFASAALAAYEIYDAFNCD